MQVAAGALSPLLRKLGDLLMAEFTLSNRMKKSVKSLRTELEMMYVFLHKVGDVPVEQLDPQVRIWADKVRELSYNMEDAVDAYMVHLYDGGHGELSRNSMKNRVNKFVKQTKKLFSKGMALHQIHGAVRDAQELAKELGELRQRYALEACANGARNIVDPRMKAVYKDITELVGIEETRDELIEKLFDGDGMSRQQLKTLSIVGFGGLGKTTLSKAVYDKIIVQFDYGVFISVSRNPIITEIFKKMLYGLDRATFAHINEAVRDNQQLIDEMRAFLNDKRYLIVIDDIWSEDAWEIIKCVFPKSNLGSRVITTTRISSVSKACCPSGSDIIHNMKPLDDDDSKRLFNKRIFSQGSDCPDELEQVSTEILRKCGGVPLAIITIASLLASNDQHIKPKYQWDKILSSIGRGLAEGGTSKDMQRILSFSYYNLPSHLKTCFLYLGVFPEDHDIRRDRLIWRWIAEGFIQAGEEEIRLFELGERYFSELINRNLIQPIYVDVEYRSEEGCDLRESSHICVENLLHLRYLGLLDTYVGVLPMKVGKLHFLQTLDLRIHGVDEVPSGVARLGHLMCLYVYTNIALPVGIGNLVSLEQLNTVCVGGTDAIEKELGKLMELRVLGLFWK
ncbi:disease resistance protein RGA5-like [Triticum dicoccoides]|uniref:disease resistance protein RGA5-like n=1 Tax=Triticum dicoccoides TaxID=85692 RepID=UPI0018910F50|nr:disease resistance protein RGA5-like [Triticum dicoccoides]